MKAAEFRRHALGLPEATEGSHQGHADFRVEGKIFATLGSEEEWAMVKLPPATQAALCESEPELFEPFAGAWGRQGCTKLFLGRAGAAVVVTALAAAWRKTAPRKLVDEYGDQLP